MNAGMQAVGLAAALGSAASWSLGTVLLDRVCLKLSPLAMTVAKGVLSVVLLGVALLAVGWAPVDGPTLGLLAISGVLGIAIGDTLFFRALQHLGAPTLIALMMVGQVLTVLGALLFLREQVSTLRWVGIAAVVGGVYLVLRSQQEAGGTATTWRGAALGLASVLCMAASVLVAKKGLDTLPSLQATFVRMAAGTATVGLLGLARRDLRTWLEPFRQPATAANFVAAVAVVTFGGFWLSLLAIKHLDVSLANTLMGTEPLFALPLGWWLARRPIRALAAGGTLVAMGGVVVLCLT